MFISPIAGNTFSEFNDVTLTTTQQWPGPFTVTSGVGAPTSGTGSTGSYYVDGTNPVIGVLYGPKASNGTWPLIGSQGTAWVAGIGAPVDQMGAGTHYVQFTFTPPSTITLVGVWGPFTQAGLSERSYLGYDQTTRQWKETNGDFTMTTDGGLAKAGVNSATTGNFSFNPQLSSYFEHTLTGNVNYAAFTPQIQPVRYPSGESRAAHLVIVLKQGGSGGYTVTWPTAFTWPNGVTPVLSTRVGDVDVFQAISMDRGLTWNAQQISSGASRNNLQTVAAKTGDYTFTRADVGNIVTLDSSSNFTFTVPTNTNVPLPNGAQITIVVAGSGHITVAGDAGVTVHGGTNLNAQGIIAELIKIGTNTWAVHH